MNYSSYMHKMEQEPHKLFFETLSNKARWEIVHLLKKRSYRATTIAKELGYEQSLISHHLKRLERCGFVTAEANGKERIYSLNKKTIKPLLELVDNHINLFCKHVVHKKVRVE